MKLSLCMIVKNEQDNLRRCLSSVVSHVDEMIVVDTGSTDDTVAIAQEFGAKVSYFEWCDDFAAARNASIQQATGDWILYLDADEELIVHFEDDSHTLSEAIQIAAGDPSLLALCVQLYSVTESGKTTPLYTPRLFQNIPEIQFEGRFHEVIYYRGAEFQPERLGSLQGVSIAHYGYTEELILQKHLHRNIPMLESLRQRGELNLMLMACLGGFYHSTGQPEQALERFSEAYELLLPHLLSGTPPSDLRMLPLLMQNVGRVAMEQEDYETVRLICQRGLEWFSNYPPLNYLTGDMLRQLGFLRGAIAYYETCLNLGQTGTYHLETPFDTDYMKTYPAYTMGCVYINLGELENAQAAFELALTFDPSFEPAQKAIALLGS